MKIAKIEGLIAAPFTPMESDGVINCKMIGPYAELLARNGVAGAFVCGSAGEGNSLSVEERQEVAETWVKESPKGFKVIVHTGANSLPDVKKLLAHAQSIGSFAGGLMAPSYYKPASAKALADYFEDVAKAAPELPLYYYHIPAMSGVKFPMIEFLEAADGRIPNLAGVKYTYEDLMDYSQCLEFKKGKYDLLFGRDEILLCAMTLGAKGAIGSTFNFAAPLYVKMAESFRAGDLATAKKLQLKSHQMIRALFGQGVAALPAQKEVMREIGIECGDARLPFSKLTTEDRRKIQKAMASVNFEEYRCR